MHEGENFIFKVVAISFTMPLILSMILAWFFVAYLKRKNQNALNMKDAALREQALLIERQSALQKERTRIAAEMHDDLGGGLTTIKFLGQRVLRGLHDESQIEGLHKIIGQSKMLIENMGEIIWAMNSENDTLEKLIAYSRRYALEFLEEYQIDIEYKNLLDRTDVMLSGERRRNLFLLLKESLHNIAKHAGASRVAIEWARQDTFLVLSVTDNGKGLETGPENTGNGLKNMDKRTRDMGGYFKAINEDAGGLRLEFGLPVNWEETSDQEV